MTHADRREPTAPELRVSAWRVQDTGLAPAPPRHRRLPGGLRHHQGEGAAWPDEVTLVVRGDELVVEGVGTWPVTSVHLERMGDGPPVTFVVAVPGSSHLLAAPADDGTVALLDALG